MLLELLMLFVIVVCLLFIIILDALFVQNTPSYKQLPPGVHIGNWRLAMALIAVNMIFIILIVYGFINVEIFYTSNYWSGNGTFDVTMYSSLEEGSQYLPYAFVFVGLFFVHLLLIIKAGYDSVQESLLTKGELEYKNKKW